MKLKGKYLPDLDKKSDLRKEDHKEVLRVMSTITKKLIMCSADPCENVADATLVDAIENVAIVDNFPFCAEHGLDYMKIHKKGTKLT